MDFFPTILLSTLKVITVPMVVWTVYFGVAIGVLMTYYNKAHLGSAVRALLEKNAFGENGALTAEELGFAKKKMIMNSIKRGALNRFVHVTDDETPRYYLIEEERHRVELRYSNKGTDLYVVIISLIVFLMVAFVAARYLPDWISAASEIAS